MIYRLFNKHFWGCSGSLPPTTQPEGPFTEAVNRANPGLGTHWPGQRGVCSLSWCLGTSNTNCIGEEMRRSKGRAGGGPYWPGKVSPATLGPGQALLCGYTLGALAQLSACWSWSRAGPRWLCSPVSSVNLQGPFESFCPPFSSLPPWAPFPHIPPTPATTTQKMFASLVGDKRHLLAPD